MPDRGLQSTLSGAMPSHDEPKLTVLLYAFEIMVGAAGIEPATPTMST